MYIVTLCLFTAFTFFLSISNVNAKRTCNLVVEEANLGIDPRDASSSEVLIDVYRCTKKTSKDMPLVVFACGGSVPKSAYYSFASGLAEKGYIVAVMEHPVTFGPPSPSSPTFNFANPVDVANTIDFIENQYYAVDTTQIVLMGHSFGSMVVLKSINEECIFPFCQDPDAPFPQGVIVPRHPGIVLAAAFGSSLLNREEGDFEPISNLDIPYAIINGDGDTNYFEVLNGENLSMGTFHRLEATKVIATIENLDHFSISDVNTSTDRRDIPSTLPLETQISTVVEAMGLWLKKNLSRNPTTTFCFQMLKHFDLADCLEDYV